MGVSTRAEWRIYSLNVTALFDTRSISELSLRKDRRILVIALNEMHALRYQGFHSIVSMNNEV